MTMTQSDVKRFSPLHTLCRYLTEGNYREIPAGFVFEYDTTGTYHSIHDYFDLHRILNQLSSNGVTYHKLISDGQEQVLKYEVNV